MVPINRVKTPHETAQQSGLTREDPLLQLMLNARDNLQNPPQVSGQGCDAAAGFIEGLPDTLCAAASRALEKHGWTAVAPGLDLLLLDIPGSRILEDGGNALIVRMAPGTRAAKHRHIGSEYNLVLEGALKGEDGMQGRGDLRHNAHGSIHAPETAWSAGCVALTVLTAPIEFLDPATPGAGVN